jgi:predicted Zn-dependent protease
MANLIDLYGRGGNPAKAREISERAVALWPANASVLRAAYLAADGRKDARAKADYLERILRIEPDNTALQQMVQQARVEEKATSQG